MIQPMNPNRKHEQRRKEKCAMYTIHAIAAVRILTEMNTLQGIGMK